MRAPLLAAGLLIAGLAPASAQLSGGTGASNATNQNFQLQNQIRGIEQQQRFDSNQIRMQIRRDQTYSDPGGGPGIVRRR